MLERETRQENIKALIKNLHTEKQSEWTNTWKKMFTFAGKKIFLIAVCLSFEMTCAKDEREHPVQLRLRKEIVFLVYCCLNSKLAQAI